MKIAVIGGGVFGCYIANLLAKESFINRVDLFEKEKSLLTGAGTNNQHRYHYGYHYPRSQETIDQIIESQPLFEQEFFDCIFPIEQNIYLIAKTGSHTSFQRFKNTFQSRPIQEMDVSTYEDYIHVGEFEGAIKTEEKGLNIRRLRSKLEKYVSSNPKISVMLDCTISDVTLIEENYDFVVNASYTDLFLTSSYKVKYELCLLVKLLNPFNLSRYAFTVMDGNFASLYPTEDENVFTLSHVEKTPLYKTESIKELKQFQSNMIEQELKSRGQELIDASLWLFKLRDPQVVGYYLTPKVKIHNDYNNLRTSEIHFNDRNITILPGKIHTVCNTGKSITSYVRNYVGR